ncbi:hypothetical protein G5714_008542 [Onychostoma macrolepis]|uniref:Uncharacterized protein n=1 Tax=Onychostoma macrolepis TaxID=369639 RepID=A0A7J6CWN7_9TELE|nr:hypothetical protein G5714_008542 [Onychostoma macrolepis]
MRVRFSPRSDRGDVIDVGEIDGPPVGGMDLAFKKLLQDENWSCSQHMVLNDADTRRDIRESEDKGAETLFVAESIRAVEEPLLGAESMEQDVVFTGVFQGQIWRVTQQEALMRRRVIAEPAPFESCSKGDTQMRRTVLTSLHQMKSSDSLLLKQTTKQDSPAVLLDGLVWSGLDPGNGLWDWDWDVPCGVGLMDSETT